MPLAREQQRGHLSLGEKRLSRLTLGRTHTLPTKDGLETGPSQLGHVHPTARSRAFRRLVPRSRPTFPPDPDPPIFRATEPLPLPPIGWRVQHHDDLPRDGFRRHARLWRGRTGDIAGSAFTSHPSLDDWRTGEARSHLGRKHDVTPSTAIETIDSGPCRRRC